MSLLRSLRLPALPRVAFVGGGGKTTAMFQLARQLSEPVWVTTSTHLGAEQRLLADRCIEGVTPDSVAALAGQAMHGVSLFARGVVDERWQGLDTPALRALYGLAEAQRIPLLVEADGSRMLPLKAPAEHEPAIPEWVNMVVVVAGLSGLNKPFSPDTVHRLDQFAAISGLASGSPIGVDAVANVLRHPEGGLKNIPIGAKRVALLNQVDTLEPVETAWQLGSELTRAYHAVIIAQLTASDPDEQVVGVIEQTAGVILAAGGSRRLAQPKQLLSWRGEPFIRQVARQSLAAGLDPVIVVTGAEADHVRQAVADLEVVIAHNPHWEEGQSQSVRTGIEAVPDSAGSALFLLADQPHIPLELIKRLIDRHSRTLAPVTAPRVGERRANPVLFDRETFNAFSALTGDIGGRAVMERFPVEWVEWEDPALLLDVDTYDDYLRLLELE